MITVSLGRDTAKKWEKWEEWKSLRSEQVLLDTEDIESRPTRGGIFTAWEKADGWKNKKLAPRSGEARA
jgi:hypothetical protein